MKRSTASLRASLILSRCLTSSSTYSDPSSSTTLVELAEGLRKRGGFKPRYRKPESVNRAVERARYANLETGMRGRLERMFAEFEKTDDLVGFAKQFSTELYRYQVRMYVTGRRTAGDYSNSLSEEELRMLHGAHSVQMRFFHKFLRDVRDGGGRMDYRQRLDMYALSGYAVYLRGAIKASGATRFFWRVNADAENCEDCLRREKLSEDLGGFSIEDLEEIGYPGEGNTRCLTRCRCHLEPVDRKLRLNRTRPTAYNGQRRSPNGTKTKRKERSRGFNVVDPAAKPGGKPGH